MKRNFSLKMAWRNIQSNRQLYVPYLISAVVTVAMFHMMASLMTNDFVLERSSTLPTLFAMGTIVVGLFSFVFIFYTNSFLVKRRKKEWGLYSILGLEKKHIARILFLETVIVGSISIIAGLLVGMLFGQLSFMFLNYLLQLPFAMTYSVSWEITGLTIILFIGLFLLTLIYNIAQVTFANPIKLLKGSSEGEKEPKSSPLLFIIGLATLGAGYWMSLTIKDPLSAISEFFLAVILVIIGTYLLFNAGSIIVLKWMKKNERFYYQPGPFISVSGMLYRMKQHATGLANISILAVMVIIAVSTTVTIFVGTEETLANRFPEENNVSFMTELGTSGEMLDTNAESVFNQINQRTIEEGLEVEDPITYRYATFMGELEGNRWIPTNMEQGFTLPSMMVVFPLEDYNQITGESLTLAEDEVLVKPAGMDWNQDSLKIAGETFQVDTIEELPYFMDATVYLIETLLVIAPDAETVDGLIAQVNANEQSSNIYWSGNLYWSTTANGEGKASYAESMNDLIYNNSWEVGVFYESRDANREEWYSINGGFLFLGIFLGGLFMVGAVLITYFKQVSEGYEDRERIQIMQKVGLDKETTRQATRSQIVWMFALPILTAVVHTVFAYPILQKMLVLFGITSQSLLILCTGAVILAFALLYWVIYVVTSKVYLSIVE